MGPVEAKYRVGVNFLVEDGFYVSDIVVILIGVLLFGFRIDVDD